MEIPPLKYLKDLFIVCIEGIYLKNTVHLLLGRGPQTLSLKGQRVNIFGFVSHNSVGSTQLHNFAIGAQEKKQKTKTARGNPETVGKGMILCQ